jgi:hypothetical protein
MHVVDTVAISFVPVRQYDREDGLGKLGERERGFTTTLTLAVIASAPVDFLWKKRVAHSTCSGKRDLKAEGREVVPSLREAEVLDFL